LIPVLVDSNVILDVVTGDAEWGEWSAAALEKCADGSVLVVNPVVYAEVSIGFQTIEELEEVLPREFFRREQVPWEAAFLAGKCFVRYRRRKGRRASTLPDFFIGAHAAVRDYRLLTRDAARFRTYFPSVELISP
jgi:predicted nucleic acid-binding protein